MYPVMGRGCFRCCVIYRLLGLGSFTDAVVITNIQNVTFICHVQCFYNRNYTNRYRLSTLKFSWLKMYSSCRFKIDISSRVDVTERCFVGESLFTFFTSLA